MLYAVAAPRAQNAIHTHTPSLSPVGDESVVAAVIVHQKILQPSVGRTLLVLHDQVPLMVLGLSDIDQLFRDKSDLAHVDEVVFLALYTIEEHIKAARLARFPDMRHDCDVRSAGAHQALVRNPIHLVPKPIYLEVAGVMTMRLVELRHGAARSEVGSGLDADNRERRFAIADLNQVVAALGHIRGVVAIGAEHEVDRLT